MLIYSSNKFIIVDHKTLFFFFKWKCYWPQTSEYQQVKDSNHSEERHLELISLAFAKYFVIHLFGNLCTKHACKAWILLNWKHLLQQSDRKGNIHLSFICQHVSNNVIFYKKKVPRMCSRPQHNDEMITDIIFSSWYCTLALVTWISVTQCTCLGQIQNPPHWLQPWVLPSFSTEDTCLFPGKWSRWKPSSSARD